MFKVGDSEEHTVGDLHLFEKDIKLTDRFVGRVLVTQFEQESRPLGVIVRPYVQALMRGAGTAA